MALAPTIGGRPRLSILNTLTVRLRTSPNKKKKFQCAGVGCTKTWQPHSRSCVLQHCKSCLRMTIEQRRLVSVASADSSPGALVAAGANKAIPAQLGTTTTATTIAEKPTPHLQPNCKANDFFGPVGHKHIANQLDLAIVKLFCTGGIAPRIADFQEWKDIFRIVIPRYVPALRTRLMDDHIMGEQERV
jgi:hypothetical protein